MVPVRSVVGRLPLNVVAVTELIPDILVELSPTIFPFAITSPVKVETPETTRESDTMLAVVIPPPQLLLQLIQRWLHYFQQQ
jgi:hypothetical protein